MATNGFIDIPAAILSFPYLFEPRADDRGKLYFSTMFVFPAGTDLSALKQAATNALLEGYKGDKAKLKEDRENGRSRGIGLRPGKEKADKGLPEDSFFITAKTDTRPEIVDQRLQKIIDQAEIYPGVVCRAQVRPYFYDAKTGRGTSGIGYWLGPIQKVRDGEKLAGAPRATSVFGELPVEDDGAVAAGGAGNDDLDDVLG